LAGHRTPQETRICGRPEPLVRQNAVESLNLFYIIPYKIWKPEAELDAEFLSNATDEDLVSLQADTSISLSALHEPKGPWPCNCQEPGKDDGRE